MEVHIALTNEQRTFLTDVMNAHVSGNRYCFYTFTIEQAIALGYYTKRDRKYLNEISNVWRKIGKPR